MMRMIPTRVHAILDYLMGLLVMTSPWLFGFGDGGLNIHLILGGGMIGAAALTDFEFGLFRVIPMPVHLILDAAVGLLAILTPWLFNVTAFMGLHIAIGVAEIGMALMTSTRPAGGRLVRA